MPTELGRSQVEVQWCPLSSEGPRLRFLRCPLGSEGPWLRSSGAHCAQKLAVEVQPCRAHSDQRPAVEVQQCTLRAERRVGKAKVDMEVDAEVVEKKVEDEEEEEKEEEEENNCDKI